MLLLALFIGFTAFITSSQANPANITISNPHISASPLTINTTSAISFNLRENANQTIATNTLKIDVSLSKLTLATTTSISGTIKNHFNIEIADQVIIFTQNQSIPANSILTANIPITAQKSSSQTISLNGVNINIAGAVLALPAATFATANAFSNAIIIGRARGLRRTLVYGARSLFAADLDGDGDIDVLSAALNRETAWFKNDGNGAFGFQQILVNRDLLYVLAADLDGDGDNDVLGTSSSHQGQNRSYWRKNDGSGTFSFGGGFGSVYSLFAIDLDGDGDNDVLSASLGGKITWFKNDGSGAFTTQPLIYGDAVGARSVFAIDLDGDGDNDVLSASSFDNKIAWYKNDGNGIFSAQLDISRFALGARSVFAIDLDSDGDNDVLSASWSDDKIAWYKNNGSGIFSAQPAISRSADGANSVFAIDLDGDGDNDVLSASENDDKIAWYENDGSGVFGSQQIITRNADNARSVFAADLDGDGDNDVLSASDDKIAWYKNNSPKPITPPQISLPDNATDTSNNLNVDIPPILTPINSGGYVDSWSISPILGGAPSFNTGSGALYGSYSSGGAGTIIPHKITAVNAGGSDTIDINIGRP